MCFGPDEDGHGKNAHAHYFTLTKYHADRFMSLLKYIFHDEPKPNWYMLGMSLVWSLRHQLFAGFERRTRLSRHRSAHDEVVAHQPRPKLLHSTRLCGKSAEVCGNCDEVATAKMLQCGVCKIVRYCDKVWCAC
ncbi:uncharacterized protein PHACADRAFT_253652 [Phanerochaete carnosa HHB-10118-sp]|uniref:MYND-type domain-containing protein n=1 Tax=Phanerochaete carnosa (strain HHB-10118-sp) TaxID=650164 RepID=K5X157_PHACS|nr:uncharacterized protein PHACADRAFT_253652 [Phanerochaete carnosa HHB-10118-sp]EKM56492.1 hypothetical protein PHACADRAFT_253652 [Phanerochaete carnosa HHB-10118-sp]